MSMATVPKAAALPPTRGTSLSPGQPLTAAQLPQLSTVPPTTAWFANIDNPNTRRAYRSDLGEFMIFVGISSPEELRLVTRAHVLAWQKNLERRALAGGTIRRKLAALSSLFAYLADANAVTHNPVKGIRRPTVESHEGKTPALGDAQVRDLLRLPVGEDLKAKRDRALLSLLLYHGLTREEIARLTVQDIHSRRGVPHLRVRGKRGTVRHIPLHPGTQALLSDYLEASGHALDKPGAVFRPMRNNRTGALDRMLSGDGIYKLVRGYAQKLGVSIGVHTLRATAAINALEHEADIATVQQWLGHASIATTRRYDRRKSRSEDSPTFKVRYS